MASWLFGYHIISYMIFGIGYLYSIGYIGKGYLSSYTAEFWNYFSFLFIGTHLYMNVKKTGYLSFNIPPVL